MIDFNPKIKVTAVLNKTIDGLAGIIERKERKIALVEFGRFPGGEVYIKSNFIDEFRLGKEMVADIEATLSGSMDELAALGLVVDALKRQIPGIMLGTLYLGYIPYGRQDRIGDDPTNASLSIRMATDFINAMEFTQVFVDHPHSSVTTALINNANDNTSMDFFMDTMERIIDEAGSTSLNPGDALIPGHRVEVGIISPDAGSLKFTDRFMEAMVDRDDELILTKAGVGFKIRDMRTGNISGTRVLDFKDHLDHYFILDDICDGGRTFTGLADAIREEHPGKPQIHLIITHGIFSKGLEALRPSLDTITAKVNYLDKDRDSISVY